MEKYFINFIPAFKNGKQIAINSEHITHIIGNINDNWENEDCFGKSYIVMFKDGTTSNVRINDIYLTEYKGFCIVELLTPNGED